MAGDSRDRNPGKRLLVLGAGPAQLGLLAAARARELYVIALDRDPSAPGFRYADRRAIVSTEDESGIERLAGAERVDGLIAPGIDWPVAIAARISQRLGVPHPISPETAALSTSKLRQRERFAEAGVPQPSYRVCSGAKEATAAAEEIGFPCVVKAPDRQGQRGLTLVSSADEVEDAVRIALDASRTATLLVEEHVSGQEVTVNAFRGRSLQPVDRHRPADRPAARVRRRTDSRLAERPRAHADRGGRRGCGSRGGGARDRGRPELHTGARRARWRACRRARRPARRRPRRRVVQGRPRRRPQRRRLSAALGEDIPPAALTPSAQVGGACVRFLVPPPGELRAVTGVEEAFALEGIRGIRIYRRRGHRFGELRRGADRAGAVLAVGGSRDEALERAAAAEATIRFETVDVEALV